MALTGCNVSFFFLVSQSITLEFGKAWAGRSEDFGKTTPSISLLVF